MKMWASRLVDLFVEATWETVEETVEETEEENEANLKNFLDEQALEMDCMKKVSCPKS